MKFIFKSFFIVFVILCIISNLNAQTASRVKIDLGVDALQQLDFELIKGKRVALLTNYAGRDKNGFETAKIFADSEKFNLVMVLTPEHGYYCAQPAGEHVGDGELYGTPVVSLYGVRRVMGKDLLDKIDVVVIDLQDIGVRAYTYLSVVYYAMKSCAQYGKQVVLLDRPNPMGGLIIDGGTVDSALFSYVGIIPVAYVHGCTFGELAQMINGEGWLSRGGEPELNCDLTVVKMDGWKRWMHWEDTGLQWIPSSPNIPTVNSIRGAAMLGPIGELGIISIGIGTTSPFQYIGLPTFNYEGFIEGFGAQKEGVRIIEARFKPYWANNAGNLCRGYYFSFAPSNVYTPYTNSIKALIALEKIHPFLFSDRVLKDKSKKMFVKVSGSKDLLDAIMLAKEESVTMSRAQKGLAEYLEIRKKYLLYD